MSGVAPAGAGDEFSELRCDPTPRLPPFVRQIGTIGPVRIHHGAFGMVGSLGHAGDERVQMMVGVPKCDCGCEGIGYAVMFLPEPDHARDLAARLIDVADRIDAQNRTLAAAALARAAGK